jgi:hypothetical protein
MALMIGMKASAFLHGWYLHMIQVKMISEPQESNLLNYIKFIRKIGVYVSTINDPYVWANYNGTLHFSNLSESYSVAGIWLITCAIALIVIPLLVYFREISPKELEEIHKANSLKINSDKYIGHI